MTREEGGSFARLAAGLADADVASLRCDLRGHGESEGRQEDLTIAGILADIRAAIALARSQVSTDRVALLGTSFSGGICGYSPSSTRLRWPAWSWQRGGPGGARLVDLASAYVHSTEVSEGHGVRAGERRCLASAR